MPRALVAKIDLKAIMEERQQIGVQRPGLCGRLFANALFVTGNGIVEVFLAIHVARLLRGKLALIGVEQFLDARLVVGDDVDLSADESDLELADVFEVDHPGLARLDEPLLECHGFLLGSGDSRYIALWRE